MKKRIRNKNEIGGKEQMKKVELENKGIDRPERKERKKEDARGKG